MSDIAVPDPGIYVMGPGLLIASPTGTAGAPDPAPYVEGVNSSYHLTAGRAETSPVGQFISHGGATVTSARIDWGDGTATTEGTVIAQNLNIGRFGEVTGDHTYVAAGTYDATVTLNVAGGQVVTATAQLIVDATSVEQAGALAFASATNVPQVGIRVAAFVANDATWQPPDFTATIDWGDGTTSAATVSNGTGYEVLSSGTYLFSPHIYVASGDHTYAAAGTFATKTTIIDPTGHATTILGQAVVAGESFTGQGLPIAALRGSGIGQPIPATVAIFTNSSGGSSGDNYSATIDWGDGTTSAGTILPAGPIFVSGDHTYATDGTYPITVRLTSIGGATATATSTATVADLQADGTTQVTTPGTVIDSPITFFRSADPAAKPGDFTATIDWGDGTAPTSGVASVVDPAAGTFGIAGNHSYAQVGDYPLTITIADQSGHSTTVTETAHVTDVGHVTDYPGQPVLPVGGVNPVVLTTGGGFTHLPGHTTPPKPVTHPKGTGTPVTAKSHHPQPPRPPAHHPRPTVTPATTLHLPTGVTPLGFFRPFSANFHYSAPTPGAVAKPAAARVRHR